MKYLLLLSFICLSACSYSQNLHIVDLAKGKPVYEQVAAGSMTKRIKTSAEQYSKYAPVPRFTEIDYAFGADAKEFKLLNSCGILYISSLNRDSSEYPVKKVYFRTEQQSVELLSLGSVELINLDNSIVKSFGKNRIDYYYLIPYIFTQFKGEIVIDWSANRTGFVAFKFPAEPLPFVTNSLLKHIELQKGPDLKFLKGFADREFDINLN